MGVAHARWMKARRAAFRMRKRFTKRDSSPLAGIETAILIVNGFDRHSKDSFDLDEARRFPWIKLCLEQVERFTAESDRYGILVWDNSFLPEHLQVLAAHPRATVFSTGAKRRDVRHGRALDRLVRKVPTEVKYVVTLDTDAFPIRAGWLENLTGRLERGASLAGIWRDEMAPAITPYVHPSCLVVRRETLLELSVKFTRSGGGQDVGQALTEAVLAAGKRVSPLRRSNARNVHFLLGGVYGDLIYHHGAGSRRASFWTSADPEGDEATRVSLRDAAFGDLDALTGFLAGDLSTADGELLGLGTVARAVSS